VPLGDSRMPTLMGKHKVPHFDAKGEANHLFTEMGVGGHYPAHDLAPVNASQLLLADQLLIDRAQK